MATPDLLFESFEATKPTNGGYDNSGWVDNIGSGSTVDPDNADIARPSGGGNQLFKYQKVSPNYDACSERYIAGGIQAISYTSLYFQATAEGLNNSETINIWVTLDDAWNEVYSFGLYQDGSGNLKIDYYLYNNGAYVDYYSSTINLNTWYLISGKYDHTNHKVTFKLQPVGGAEEIVANEIDLIGTHKAGVYYAILGDDYNTKTVTGYIDLLQMSSTGWPGEGNSVLKRWTGTSWVKAKNMARVSGSWQSRSLKRWTGTEWVDVDGLGG
jgi:archaellin